jgi:hypothetical protein
MANDGSRDPRWVVVGSARGEPVELPPVGNAGGLAAVVPRAQRLAVVEAGASASAVRVDVIGFESVGDRAPAVEDAVVFAGAAGPGQDQRLVRAGEPAQRIAGQQHPPCSAD